MIVQKSCLCSIVMQPLHPFQHLIIRMKRVKLIFLLLSALSGIRESLGCFILFVSDGQHVIVGNHEDWFATDAAVRINPPTQGSYGTVIFTFESEGWAQGGMNEKGLFFDGAHTPFQEINFDGHAGKYPGYIWQAVLDKCATVEEAIKFIGDYE